MNLPIGRSTQRVLPQRSLQQRNSLQKNNTGSVQASPSQLIKTNTLSIKQKLMIHNLISLLSAASKKSNSDLKSFDYNQILFNVIPPPDALFSKTEIVTIVAQSEICKEGKESEFLDSLIEVCTLKQEHQDAHKNIEKKELPLPAKKLLYDLNIEEKPVIIEKINLLLEQIMRSPTAVSDELKKKLLDILKDSEEDDEIEGLKFDYAEVSEVIA